jgi:hypothetical protein
MCSRIKDTLLQFLKCLLHSKITHIQREQNWCVCLLGRTDLPAGDICRRAPGLPPTVHRHSEDLDWNSTGKVSLMSFLADEKQLSYWQSYLHVSWLNIDRFLCLDILEMSVSVVLHIIKCHHNENVPDISCQHLMRLILLCVVTGIFLSQTFLLLLLFSVALNSKTCLLHYLRSVLNYSFNSLRMQRLSFGEIYLTELEVQNLCNVGKELKCKCRAKSLSWFVAKQISLA